MRLFYGAVFLALLLAASFIASPLAAQTPRVAEAVAAQSGERGASPVSEQVKPRSGWAVLPLVSYTPETELGLGEFVVHFFRLGDAPASSRTSSIAVLALYTTRDQIIVESRPEFYWDSEQWHIWSKIDYRFFPNDFWGVGSNTPERLKESYTENAVSGEAQLRRTIYNGLYADVRAHAQYLKVQDVKSGGLLDTGAVIGAAGGRTVGAGAAFGWDTRDQAISPRTGAFYELSFMNWLRILGGEYDYSRTILDLRQYFSTYSAHVLALQLYGEFINGEVPFYQLALLGGQRLLRGYYEGRYRDYDYLAAQAEYRLPIWRRLGAVLFAGAGDVSDRLTNFSLQHVKWTTGGGLRLLLNRDERLNLRADLALGLHTWGVYLGIAEAF